MEVMLEQPDIQLEQLAKSEVYKNSTLLEKFRLQREKKEFGDFLVCAFSDIDGTYIYFYKPTDEEKQLPESELTILTLGRNVIYKKHSQEVSQFLEDHNIPNIAVTARDLETVKEGQSEGIHYEEQHLPMFDVIAPALGTEVYVKQKDGKYVPDNQFDSYIREKTDFRRGDVYRACSEFQEKLKRLKSEINFKFQERDSAESTEQSLPYKISFNFEGDKNTVAMLNSSEGEQSLLAELNKNDFRNIKLIFSWSCDLDNGNYRYDLDVVPLTKKDTVDYLAGKFGCMAFIAGDSGNDEEMILQSESVGAGIVVGGAKDELQRAVLKIKGESKRKTPHFTVLPDGRLLFDDSSTTRKGPQSLLKAIRAFRLLSQFMIK